MAGPARRAGLHRAYLSVVRAMSWVLARISDLQRTLMAERPRWFVAKKRYSGAATLLQSDIAIKKGDLLLVTKTDEIMEVAEVQERGRFRVLRGRGTSGPKPIPEGADVYVLGNVAAEVFK